MEWLVDQSHAEVGFTARHLMVSKVRGAFKNFEAQVQIDEDEPSRSYVRATIDAISIDTKTAERDAHLRSADFLDVENYPQITFESTSVDLDRKGALEVVGDLTIRGVTHEVRLTGEYEGPIADPWGNRRLGVSLSGEVDREDFGLTWNMAIEAGGVLVGRQIKLSIDIELSAPAREPALVEAASAS